MKIIRPIHLYPSRKEINLKYLHAGQSIYLLSQYCGLLIKFTTGLKEFSSLTFASHGPTFVSNVFFEENHSVLAVNHLMYRGALILKP